MKWYDTWYAIYTKQQLPTELTQQQIDLLTEKVSAYKALDEQRNQRLTKYGTNKIRRSSHLGYELYKECAQYYEECYTDLKCKLGKYDYNRNTATCNKRNRNYLRGKYEKIIQRVMSKPPIPKTDDEVIERIYKGMKSNAFSQEELDIWQDIYTYATTVTQKFVVVKRSDRRTHYEPKCTYIEFANWYATNSAVYSSTDRRFVPLFTAYCPQQGKSVKSTKVSNMLRYFAEPQFFANADLNALGFITSQQIQDFFDTLDLIKQTSQKK